MANSTKRFALIVLTLIAALLFAALLVIHYRKTHVYDGFESAELDSRWSRNRMVPGSFRTQSQIVRAGRSAAEITVHSRDRREEASDDGDATERDELMEAWWLFGHTGRAYRYTFSLYLPADFPIVPQRLILAQWRHACEWTRCRPQNPILAIRYQNGELTVTRQDETGKFVLYSTKQEIRGRWLDFRFDTKFSRFGAGDQAGYIYGWLDGQPIVSYQGATLYQIQRGYPAHGYIYFKMGLYRDELPQPMTMYLDEYRKDELSR